MFTLYVSFSHFTFEIKLLNLNEKSHFNDFERLGKGTYGSVGAFKLF